MEEEGSGSSGDNVAAVGITEHSTVVVDDVIIDDNDDDKMKDAAAVVVGGEVAGDGVVGGVNTDEVAPPSEPADDDVNEVAATNSTTATRNATGTDKPETTTATTTTLPEPIAVVTTDVDNNNNNNNRSNIEYARNVATVTVSNILLEGLENEYNRLKDERDELQIQYDHIQMKLQDANSKLLNQQELNMQISTYRNEIQLLNTKSITLQEEKKSIQERLDRMQLENDTIRDEVSRLNQSNNELTKQVTNYEIQSKLTESEAIPLYHEKQRLTTEIESLQSHTNWLEQELSSKSKQYQHLQRESRDRIIQLQLQLDHVMNERDGLSVRLSAIEKIERKLQDKVNQLSIENLNYKQEITINKSNYEIELQEEKKIQSLQKEHIIKWQQRYNDIEKEKLSLQNTAKEAIEITNQEIENERNQLEQKYKLLLQEQANDYERKIQELITSSSISNSPSQVVVVGHQQRMLLTATAAGTGEDNEQDEEEPLSMTDLYQKLEETKSALRQEQMAHKMLQLNFSTIQKQIKASAPKLIRQREEYELAMDQLTSYQQRLESALAERNDASADANEARQITVQLQKKLIDKQEEIQELAKQVQGLLMSRSSSGSNTGGSYNDADIPTTVQEMQSQNQQLVIEHRRLTQKVTELEDKIKSDNMLGKLEAATTEVKTLRDERKQQELLVNQIVQQRDLYRALLSKHDSNLLGSETEELTALEMAKQQSERSKKLQELNKDLELEIKSIQAKMELISGEKEELAIRLNRHEIHSAELTKSIDELERDVRTSRSNEARSTAEAQYHKEHTDRLESSLERARSEIVHINNSKNELQRINTDLQQMLSNMNSERTGIDNEKRQLENKLRLLQTQLETAKAAAKRVSEENNQLRSEVVRQDSLIDSIRRIEASLSASSESEKEALRKDKETLTQRLTEEATRFKTEMENMTIRVQHLEANLQDVTTSKEKIQSETLESKDKLAATLSELKTLKTRCELLESQLTAAKKKMGEADDDTEDIEVLAAQSKMEKMETEMDSVKAERDALQQNVETYQRLAKDSEKALADLQKVMEQLRNEKSEEVDSLKRQVDNYKKDSASKDELIRDFTKDLANQRGEREEAERELKSKIMLLETQIQNNEKDVQSAKATAAVLSHDMEALQAEVETAQKNFERELGLHSQARTALRAAREEADEQSRLRQTAEDKLEEMQKELSNKVHSWENEKASTKQSIELLEKRVKDAHDQNVLLHTQLDTLTSMVEKSQASRVAAAGEAGSGEEVSSDPELQKITSELREIVKFLRSDNELLQVQLDTAKRTADRERAASNVLRRSLDEAQAELSLLRSDAAEPHGDGDATIKEQDEKLKANQEQLLLLKDSNKLLREEMEKLESELSTVQGELDAAKAAAQPSQNVQRSLESKITTMEAEKDSLKRELDSWKARVQNLVSKLNQIDPEEHRRLIAQVEELQKEKESLNAWKKTTEEESHRIRTIAKTLNQKNKELKTSIDSQQKDIEKLNAEKATWASASSANTAIAKELDEVKEKMAKLETDAESKQRELNGANSRNERFRDKLREFQTTIRDLRMQVKTLTEELEVAKSQSTSTVAPSTGASVAVVNIDAMAAAASKEEKTSDLSNKLEPALPVATEKPVPSVPQGGFKFGPSESTRAQVAKIELQKSPHPSSLRPSAPAFVPPIKPTSTAETATPAVVSKPSSAEIAVKDIVKTGEVSTPDTAALMRRPSGESKELSMKEILIAKKMKLAALKRKAEGDKTPGKPDVTGTNVEGGSKVGKADSEADEVKRTESTELAPPAKRSKNEVSGDQDMATESVIPEVSEEAKLEKVENIRDPGDKGSSFVDTTTNTADDGRENAPLVEAKLNTPEPTNIFAAATPVGKTPFGSLVFGQSSSIVASQPTFFGQSSSVVTSEPTSSGKQEAASSSVFLDIKPPGTTTPPTFTFGSSSSIMLPTPSIPTPAPIQFDAFGPGTGFGSSSGGSMPSIPLFSSTPRSEDPPQEDNEE